MSSQAECHQPVLLATVLPSKEEGGRRAGVACQEEGMVAGGGESVYNAEMLLQCKKGNACANKKQHVQCNKCHKA